MGRICTARYSPTPVINKLYKSSMETSFNFTSRGCPVCDSLSKAMFEYFSKWQYALINDGREQRDFAARGGFCAVHLWQLASLSSPRGLSISIPPLLERLANNLSELASLQKLDTQAIHSISTKNCAACEFLRLEEASAIENFSEIIKQEDCLLLYKKSQGVCLHHLGRIVLTIKNDSLRRKLLSLAAKRFGDWIEDMQSYVSKRDTLQRALISIDEEEANIRAIIHLVGARALCLPPKLNK